MKYCANCGTEIEEGMGFCGNCGESAIDEITAESGSAEESPSVAISAYNDAIAHQNKKKTKAKLAVLIVLIVLIVVFAGLNIIQFINHQSILEVKETEIGELKNRTTELKVDVANLENQLRWREDAYTKLEIQVKGLRNDVTRLEDEVSQYDHVKFFLDNSIAFVPGNGQGLYHRYSCSTWTSFKGTYWIYNVENARANGYRPHSCWTGW